MTKTKHEAMLLKYIMSHLCIYDIEDAPSNIKEERCAKYNMAHNTVYHACLACFHDWLKEDL